MGSSHTIFNTYIYTYIYALILHSRETSSPRLGRESGAVAGTLPYLASRVANLISIFFRSASAFVWTWTGRAVAGGALEAVAVAGNESSRPHQEWSATAVAVAVVVVVVLDVCEVLEPSLLLLFETLPTGSCHCRCWLMRYLPMQGWKEDNRQERMECLSFW